MAKHFLKVLSIFIVMIILGLIGISVINYFSSKEEVKTTDTNNQVQVAK